MVEPLTGVSAMTTAGTHLQLQPGLPPPTETEMATSVDSMPVELDAGALQTRYLELGEMAIRHVSVPAGADMSVLLAGLPNDRCPSPHWGIILEGSIHLTHGDGSTETARAGQVYHWAA